MTVRTERFRLRGVHFLYDPVHVEPKHGHEYFLEIAVNADVAREKLHQIVEREIIKPWDKTDWNKKGLAQASGELLVEEFDRILRGTELKNDLKSVVLKETRKNRFISAGSSLAYGE